MFKAKSKFTDKKETVYSINEKGDKFFVYSSVLEKWTWVDCKNYIPVEEEKTADKKN